MQARGADAVAAYEHLLDGWAQSRPDTAQRLKSVVNIDAEMPLAQSTRAVLLLLSGKRALVAPAREAATRARDLARGASEREQLHADAAFRWATQGLASATRIWEQILCTTPQDFSALKLAQFGHFYGGDANAMVRCSARSMEAFDATTPRYAQCHGIHAFSLEEAGHIEAAESCGRRAVELDRRDPWAIHAVAHCMETARRPQEGCEWIDAFRADWHDALNLAGHLRWHRALFELDAQSPQAVLAHFDDDLASPESEEYLDLCNDVALLQRLELCGIDVGDRWHTVSNAVLRIAEDHTLAFCDAHWALALAAGERHDALDDLLRRMIGLADGDSVDAAAWRLAAVPLAAAMRFWRNGDPRAAFRGIWACHDQIRLLGGSNAQRDLFEQILIRAAIDAGHTEIADTLMRERRRVRGVEAFTIDDVMH